jgi:hypothetical protein
MQIQGMRISYIPVMHFEKMAVTNMPFRQRAVTEFLVKEGNSAGSINERLRGVYGDVLWVAAVSEGGRNILRKETLTSP